VKRSVPCIISLRLVLSLAASGCSYFSSQQKQPQAGASDGGRIGQAHQTEKQIEPYPILGASNKLTAKERSSMNKWREDIVQVAGHNPGEVFINGPSSVKAVCLTFDDGPDGVFTPKVLDILKQYGVHGSFFFIGQRVKNYPAVVRRADREGNLVLNHTWDHKDLSHLSDLAIRNEITMTGDEIASITGKRPALVRPPYGAVNDRVIRDLQGGNCKIAIWSIDTLDWSQKDKANIARNVMDNVRPGDIILMHSNAGRQATVDALPAIITGLQAEGYGFLTLADMLNVPAYQ